jgi:hypothetical protein
MGGMMGAMLGVMLQPKSIDIMDYYVDLVFVLVIVLLIGMIDEETKMEKQETSVRKPLIANLIILVAILVFMVGLVCGKGMLYQDGSIVSAEANHIKFAPASSEIQEVLVKPSGYTPNNIILKARKPSIINYKPEILGCTGIFLSRNLVLMSIKRRKYK